MTLTLVMPRIWSAFWRLHFAGTVLLITMACSHLTYITALSSPWSAPHYSCQESSAIMHLIHLLYTRFPYWKQASAGGTFQPLSSAVGANHRCRRQDSSNWLQTDFDNTSVGRQISWWLWLWTCTKQCPGVNYLCFLHDAFGSDLASFAFCRSFLTENCRCRNTHSIQQYTK